MKSPAGKDSVCVLSSVFSIKERKESICIVTFTVITSLIRAARKFCACSYLPWSASVFSNRLYCLY